MGPKLADPVETLGTIPDGPLPCWGWGDIPDQYGRRWNGDDGSTPMPPAPDGMANLPPILPWWEPQPSPGRQASLPSGEVTEIRPSVLECMNDMAFMCEIVITRSGGLAITDIADLNQALRRNINSARGYQPPIDLTAERYARHGEHLQAGPGPSGGTGFAPVTRAARSRCKSTAGL